MTMPSATLVAQEGTMRLAPLMRTMQTRQLVCGSMPLR